MWPIIALAILAWTFGKWKLCSSMPAIPGEAGRNADKIVLYVSAREGYVRELKCNRNKLCGRRKPFSQLVSPASPAIGGYE